MRRKKSLEFVLFAAAACLIGGFALIGSPHGAAGTAPPTDEQVLADLGARITAVGVEIRASEVLTDRPHVLSYEVIPGNEPVGVTAYRIWREAALAKTSGLPVQAVQVLAFDGQGLMVFGQTQAIDPVQDSIWQTPPTLDLRTAAGALQSRVASMVPQGIESAFADISIDPDGFRTAEIDLVGEPSSPGTSAFRDFITVAWAETSALNTQGARVASVTVKLTDDVGELQLWDVYDFQVAQEGGWHSPAFLPSWLPSPVQAQTAVSSTAN